VANSGPSAPMVTVTDPPLGAPVNAVVTLAATVASPRPVASLQFYLDDVAVGAPVTRPPFATFWDTEAVADGTHSLTATATDTSGGVGTSAPVSVTVDNSRPANPIHIDAQAIQDGLGTLTSPPFATTTDSDLLVAFVARRPRRDTADGHGHRCGRELDPAEAQQLPGGYRRDLGRQGDRLPHGRHRRRAAGRRDRLPRQPGGPRVHQRRGTGHRRPGERALRRSGRLSPGIAAGNWVFAVGNDGNSAAARTPVSGQYLVHQRLDTDSGDTYWVQATARRRLPTRWSTSTTAFRRPTAGTTAPWKSSLPVHSDAVSVCGSTPWWH